MGAAAVGDRAECIVDFVAFNLLDLTERFDQAAARGLDGAKRIASIVCSRVGQKEIQFKRGG
jgi:hypothetical protein